jgi:L-iditol 2-dehydrogenase
MRALQFRIHPLLGSWPGSRPPSWAGALLRPFLLRLVDVPEPSLLGPDWVKIRTHYGGICGSDLSLIGLHGSPALTPFMSQTFVLGHEQTGTVVEAGDRVDGFEPGQRVVVDPLLPCPVRGIDPPCPACQAGEWTRCENFAEGDVSPGLVLGFCADTGGSWSPYFLAHKFQLFALPPEVSDENGLLIEPLTIALHAVMHSLPQDDGTVLVIGAGVLGICTVAALRCLGVRAHVTVIARYPFQAQLAERYGADEVIVPHGTAHYHDVAETLGGRLYTPLLGRPVMIGGADVVYDCVGSDHSLDDALRFAKAGGRLVVIGTIGQTASVDWTPLWFQELNAMGVNTACAIEEYGGQRLRTFEWAIRLMSERGLDLSPLLTHRFPLRDYRGALAVAMHKGRHRAVKVAFEFA